MHDKNKYVSARISHDRRDRLRKIVLNHELATGERITIDSLIANAVDATFPEAK
jgi:hypothetical protein